MGPPFGASRRMLEPVRRPLAPSFVVTTCALSSAASLAVACHATQTATTSVSTVKRHHGPGDASVVGPDGYYANWDYGSSEGLNPTDAQGHAVYVGSDDTCYFETP